MAPDTWSFIQTALLFFFEPIIGYWLTGIAVTGILTALYIMILALLRWLTGKGTLI